MQTSQKTIRTLVVDDSKVALATFSRILDADPTIEVVGTARDPYEARDLVVQLEPDVLTLDIEMPRMDGLTFLGKLMRYRPTPVVVVSAFTPAGGTVAMRALAAGAVDVLCKPSKEYDLDQMSVDLVHHVKAAAAVRKLGTDAAQNLETGTNQVDVQVPELRGATRDLIAIGSSTGGPEALRMVLAELPRGCPPVVIVQHIPPVYSASLADSLTQATTLDVVEASDGQALRSGMAYIAPGDRHLEVRGSTGRYTIRLHDEPPVNRHRPSVDVTMASVAESAGRRAVGAILTGMGRDGADGLLAMRRAGARTMAQDEQSCVVFGMPCEALKNGGAERAVPLADLPAALVEALQAEPNA